MSLSHLGWFAAFGAGLLSFLSPCVLPLVPGYLSYLAGTHIQEVREGENQKSQRFHVGFHALWFVLLKVNYLQQATRMRLTKWASFPNGEDQPE